MSYIYIFINRRKLKANSERNEAKRSRKECFQRKNNGKIEKGAAKRARRKK